MKAVTMKRKKYEEEKTGGGTRTKRIKERDEKLKEPEIKKKKKS